MLLLSSFGKIYAIFCVAVLVNANNLTVPNGNHTSNFFVFDTKIELISPDVQVRVNDILYCSVNTISVLPQQVIQTEPSLASQYTLAPPEGCINFLVLAQSNALITLSTDLSSTSPTFTIHLGTSWNTKSIILRNNGTGYTIVNTPNLLSSNQYRGFWIEWNYNMLRVGKQSESKHFMILNDPKHPKINFIGFATGASPGTWLVRNPESNCFEQNNFNLGASCSL